MRADGNTIRGNETVIPHVNLEPVRAWAKAPVTRERLVTAALCAATVTLIGVVLFSLYRAMENYTIVGF